MKRIITLLAVICTLIISSCTDMSYTGQMDTFKDVLVMPTDSTCPCAPGFFIHIVGNMRPQRYLLEYTVDGKETVSKWMNMNSNTDILIPLNLEPGTYEVWVKLGMNTGHEPYWMCDETIEVVSPHKNQDSKSSFSEMPYISIVSRMDSIDTPISMAQRIPLMTPARSDMKFSSLRFFAS